MTGFLSDGLALADFCASRAVPLANSCNNDRQQPPLLRDPITQRVYGDQPLSRRRLSIYGHFASVAASPSTQGPRLSTVSVSRCDIGSAAVARRCARRRVNPIGLPNHPVRSPTCRWERQAWVQPSPAVLRRVHQSRLPKASSPRPSPSIAYRRLCYRVCANAVCTKHPLLVLPI